MANKHQKDDRKKLARLVDERVACTATVVGKAIVPYKYGLNDRNDFPKFLLKAMVVGGKHVDHAWVEIRELEDGNIPMPICISFDATVKPYTRMNGRMSYTLVGISNIVETPPPDPASPAMAGVDPGFEPDP